MVKLKKINERRNMSASENMEYRKKLKQLTDSCKLPEKMGELLLLEIKLSNDKANEHLRERVKLLGLW